MRVAVSALTCCVFVLGCSGENPASQVQAPAAAGTRIHSVARAWVGKHFHKGEPAQAVTFVREVLKKACGPRFERLQTQRPWDFSLLGVEEELAPWFADSLAGDEIGPRIRRLADVRAGDLVFLRNTYGHWPKGVITHVGIAGTVNGTFIDRPTSASPVRLAAIPRALFVGAVRVQSRLCGVR